MQEGDLLMGTHATHVLVYDKENKQKNYMYMAKDEENHWKIGWIVIYKPWYWVSEDRWTYYIVDNLYGDGGYGGSATDLGFKKIKVDPETILPYTQKNQIKKILDEGDSVVIEKVWGKPTWKINPGDEMPDIWEN